MSEASPLPFGDLLRHYRLAAGLTQAELAERAGLSVRGINDLERGARQTPRKETVALLADALRLTDDARVRFASASRPGPPSPASPANGTPAGARPNPVATSAIHTFLIADVRGYTTFTVAHGDEAAARLAGLFAHLARAGVEAHGGRVLELRGDEALAIFASARQALRAAVALQAQFAAASRADPTLPLAVGIGLDAGEAVPVESGFRGTALNLAARLCSLAGPGEVLASAELVHLAGTVAGLAYQERGTAQLKGFADPVRVLQVLPVLPVPPAAGRTADQAADHGAAAGHQQAAATSSLPVQVQPQRLPVGGYLGALPDGPLVAREAELARLLAVLEVVAGGEGRLVLLAGEPGIGKTRLAQEVTLAARNRGFLVATGRCYEPQEAVAYYPFLEALSMVFAAAPAPIRAQVPQRWAEVARLLPDQPVGVRPMGGSAGGSPAGGSPAGGSRDDQQRLFWQVTGFLQVLAAGQPVALLLDDLHWADGASLDLLQHLARHARSDRVLLLGTYRDVEVGRQHALEAALRDLARDRLLERLAVRRLDRVGTRALIAAAAGQDEVPSAFVAHLYQRTEGNPFFTQEVLRALIERGDVYREQGQWTGRALEQIAVPESVRAVIGQRLAHLAAETQEVLREASVLGQTFRFAELAGTSGHAEERLEPALEEAERAGLVHEAGHDRYTFHHALIQQTLYAELPARRRRRLHRAAGEALEQVPARERERRVAELAWHFLAADEPARALPSCLQAGDQAEAVYAHAEAERHYRTALELARELGDAAREAAAAEGLGVVCYAQGGPYDEAATMLETALRHYTAHDDRDGLLRAAAKLGHVHCHLRTYDEGIVRLRSLVEPVDPRDAPRRLAELYLALARLAFMGGRGAAEALAPAERARTYAQQVPDRRLQALAEVRWGSALLVDFRIREGVQAIERAIPELIATEELEGLGIAYPNLCATCWPGAQWERLERYAAALLDTAQRLDAVELLAWLSFLRGAAAFFTGDWRRARADLQAVGTLVRERLGPEQAATDTNWLAAEAGLGWLELCEGRPAEAEAHFAGVLAANPPARAIDAATAHLCRAEAALLAGHAAEAREHLGRVTGGVARTWTEWATGIWGHGHLLLAWALDGLGEPAPADVLVAEVLAFALETNHAVDLAAARWMQTLLAARRGEAVAETEAELERTVALSTPPPWPHVHAKLLYAAGLLAERAGELDRARDRFTQALAICARLGEGLYRPHIARALAELGAPGAVDEQPADAS